MFYFTAGILCLSCFVLLYACCKVASMADEYATQNIPVSNEKEVNA